MASRPPARADCANPFAPGWTETGLHPLACRAHSGEPPVALADELLGLLWPWATATADRMARRLPPGADSEALRSEVLWEVFQATRRIDWDRYDTWPALLRDRLRSAWSAAARAQDPLTRGQRAARRAFLAAEEELTQRTGRTPTPGERDRLAAALSPHGETAPILLGRAILAPMPQAPMTAAGDDDPAVALVRSLTRRAVRAWIDEDLPPKLAECVRALVVHDAGDRMTAALRRRLRPHLGALRQRLGDVREESDGSGLPSDEPGG